MPLTTVGVAPSLSSFLSSNKKEAQGHAFAFKRYLRLKVCCEPWPPLQLSPAQEGTLLFWQPVTSRYKIAVIC